MCDSLDPNNKEAFNYSVIRKKILLHTFTAVTKLASGTQILVKIEDATKTSADIWYLIVCEDLQFDR
ncbi:hypothetical protein RR46_07312 [Papilio xuthus]|uniref:Uncharacterized protein n=1 Tax=Papilio xuthus TaxID=66420 RepID=A0A194Q2D4_PAPXU|nr:hypothetical protein RR46_07312 [Papilio xuthus]